MTNMLSSVKHFHKKKTILYSSVNVWQTPKNSKLHCNLITQGEHLISLIVPFSKKNFYSKYCMR